MTAAVRPRPIPGTLTRVAEAGSGLVAGLQAERERQREAALRQALLALQERGVGVQERQAATGEQQAATAAAAQQSAAGLQTAQATRFSGESERDAAAAARALESVKPLKIRIMALDPSITDPNTLPNDPEQLMNLYEEIMQRQTQLGQAAIGARGREGRDRDLALDRLVDNASRSVRELRQTLDQLRPPNGIFLSEQARAQYNRTWENYTVARRHEQELMETQQRQLGVGETPTQQTRRGVGQAPAQPEPTRQVDSSVAPTATSTTSRTSRQDRIVELVREKKTDAEIRAILQREGY